VEAEQAEALEGPKMLKVKEHENRHYFADAKVGRPIALAFGIGQQLLVFRRFRKVV
jgi:hypothetical protein